MIFKMSLSVTYFVRKILCIKDDVKAAITTVKTIFSP